MRLKILIDLSLPYCDDYGIWAKLINGRFSFDSPCRCGKIQDSKEKDWQLLGTNAEIEKFVYCYWNDRSEPDLAESEDPDYDWLREEAISELISEKNQELL